MSGCLAYSKAGQCLMGFVFCLWCLHICKAIHVLDVCLSSVKHEIVLMWKFWLKFSYFHYLISALTLHSSAKLRNFTLLQDLIQKYEGDLSQLSKRCEEMKKLYTSVLVRLILKCNERNLNFLRIEEKCRSSHASMCIAVILSTGGGHGWNVLKEIVFYSWGFIIHFLKCWLSKNTYVKK